ncbi:MAG: protease HtpX [Magnetococcales bacterium]|nr:protease HtpX [Magnetococcales bacterium]
MKRIFYFLLTNLAIMAVLMVVLNILMSFLGIDHGSIGGLLMLALVFGMGGSFISLAMSKWIAKRSTGAVVIQSPSNETEQWLMTTVERQARNAGIGMPEVAIFDSPEINAFATGASRNNSLVAVSTGLLRALNKQEAEAVMAHEVSHVANGDMVTLALIQGVLNTFVIFLARIIGGVVDSAMSNSDDEEEGESTGMAYFVVSIIAEIVLGVLASIVVMWFSRQREFRADKGGADLAGRQAMISALERLQQSSMPSQLPDEVAAFGLSGKQKGALASMFSSHPPLEQRIAALKQIN